ncbi:MAG: hypothetical protein IKN12_08780, partial [Selenomonadaceae bacterium]|nr:hypothetical protein [Selenomonadaceae bacterium]
MNLKKNPQKKFKINSGETGSIAVDCVLSFNYTDTTHMLYVPKDTVNFINGKLESNHIILGTENLSPKQTEIYCEDNSCLFFK